MEYYLPMTAELIRAFKTAPCGTGWRKLQAIKVYRAMQVAAGKPRPGLKLAKMVVEAAIYHHVFDLTSRVPHVRYCEEAGGVIAPVQCRNYS